MAAPMEGSLTLTGSLLEHGGYPVPIEVEEFVVKEFTDAMAIQFDDLIINGTSNTIPNGNYEGSTSDHYEVDSRDWQTTGGDIHINNTFEFEGAFEMTPEQIEKFKEVLMGQPVVKKRVIPKHRMIRED